MGVALSPHPGRPQQDRHPQHPAAVPQGEVLPHEDDDAQVGYCGVGGGGKLNTHDVSGT